MEPGDLLAATEFVVGTLRPTAGRDWSVRAGTLDWDVAFTVTHVAAALTKYTAYLAAAATKWSPLVLRSHDDASNDGLLDGVEIGASALAFVAAHADTARGFHAGGMLDAEGYLALAAIEVLVHGWDAATGLGLEFIPPSPPCAAAVRRRFPWVEEINDPWQTLLTATGRFGGGYWRAVYEPIDEWDGTIPGGDLPAPAVAWSWDEVTRRWKPTYP